MSAPSCAQASSDPRDREYPTMLVECQIGAGADDDSFQAYLLRTGRRLFQQPIELHEHVVTCGVLHVTTVATGFRLGSSRRLIPSDYASDSTCDLRGDDANDVAGRTHRSIAQSSTGAKNDRSSHRPDAPRAELPQHELLCRFPRSHVDGEYESLAVGTTDVTELGWCQHRGGKLE